MIATLGEEQLLHAVERPARPDHRVGELMSWSLHTVTVATACSHAASLAAARGIRHLPVLDGGVLVGVLCTCDLWGSRVGEPCGQRMHTPVITVPANALASQAAALMKEHDVGSLPVLYHGFLIGMVTAGDLVRAGTLRAADLPTCAACGSHQHVRQLDGAPRALCLRCRVSSEPTLMVQP